MSTPLHLLHPAGPEPDSVYWRRRIIVLLGVLAVIGVVVKLVFGGDSGAVSTAPSQSEVPIVFATLTPSDFPVAIETADATATDQGSNQTATSNPMPSSQEAVKCSDDDILVKVDVDRNTASVSTGIHATLTITNTSRQTCIRDIGSGANEVFIKTGDTVVWSSDYCNTSTAKNLVTFKTNSTRSFTVTWNGVVTGKNCELGNKATAGTYRVFARNKTAKSSATKFLIK